MAESGRRDGIISLFLIDDHPVVGLGLSLALSGHARLRLAGSAVNRFAGLRAIEALQPDALVVDLVFDGEAETAFVGECRSAAPGAVIVVFSSLPRRAYEREVIERGADTYVAKSADLQVLLDTVLALSGRPRPDASSSALPAGGEAGSLLIDGVHLTPREGDVARRLAEGVSIARIASDLGISPNTVGVHRDNIRKKLKCRDMTELVALLARHRVLDHG
ncbi:response regulator transcription factor [Ensifer soli]|uniref:response regulator transcription factor n=1 Tax=Ciceribacter sp. sgz301302 TaxID=3342379 RepID=UPI0035BA032A